MNRKGKARRRIPVTAAILMLVVGCSVSRPPGRQSVDASRLRAPVPGEPQGPLVPLDVAQSRLKWKIQVPSYLPSGVTLQGVLEDSIGDGIQNWLRIHYSNGVVLLEGPDTSAAATPRGRATMTTVNGYPGLAIEGPLPHHDTDPVSQVEWWTGTMFFDVYGPVAFQDVRRMADSM
jgi:hypothetical protein